MVSRFRVRPTSKRWFLKQSKWPCNMIPSMPRRNPRRLYIHLAATYSLSPSSVVWCDATRTWTGSAFSTNERCLKCNGHGFSVSCVKWPEAPGSPKLLLLLLLLPTAITCLINLGRLESSSLKFKCQGRLGQPEIQIHQGAHPGPKPNKQHAEFG